MFMLKKEGKPKMVCPLFLYKRLVIGECGYNRFYFWIDGSLNLFT